MDFRLGPTFKSWLEERGYLGDVDEVSVAGACKEFVADPNSCIANYLFGQIQISSSLHGISRVILTQHEDCGAYGGQASFASAEAEKLKLVADMRKLKAVIKERLPQLEVSMVFIKKLTDHQWEFEEVTD
jgi:carbonic anhydrase